MPIHLDIACTHLRHHGRSTLVSLGGIALGVAFFLAVSALMRGSEQDFLQRLVDNSPHITVYDQYRTQQAQPAELRWPQAVVSVSNAKPLVETRGIRGYRSKLEQIEALPGIRVAPLLHGSAVLVFAGQQQGISLSGVEPPRMKLVSAIERHMVAGSLDELGATPNGVIIGEGLAAKFRLRMGGTLTVVSAGTGSRVMKVVGIFRTGNAAYDETETFTLLKRAQAILDRPNRVNRFIIQLADPHAAVGVAAAIERSIGYKSVSWIEASEDLLNLLLVRNIIMYSVVSAILVVAAFGIYNTIFTIVVEKTRDIAILKSIGFRRADMRRIFLWQGGIIGLLGSVAGLLLGNALMRVLAIIELKPPGVSEVVRLPVWWGVDQYLLAAGFAMASCLGAAYLPASKAGKLRPVDILRGAT
ncbi:ABC transporter permease [Pseudoduganella aquatica]|uniref:FtsX-like permease family protein n=1 Tax=Pseudoduganella aquatica TaxID=2660641 RepID=A0A7X4HCD0_9BURK|nr:ABC transporter permease [Pseudoduganella aquatica]MYN08609.1 FtsX-like permease family protein [Pseudoduganella aquatica]